MKDIVDELRAFAKDHDGYSPALAALLMAAAAEIERLRGTVSNPWSYAELVKDLKHHLRGETDG